MNVKNYIYSALVLCFISINTFGQSPAWSVNENNFEYTMTFVSFINIDGTTLTSTKDKVAAFVNGECRGVTSLTYVASEEKYYAYLTVFSNENSEILNFKIFDSLNEVVKDVPKTKIFEINKHYGNLFQAFSIASPALSAAAEITDFNFNGVEIVDKTIEGDQIRLSVSSNQNLINLNSLFDLSAGAKLFIGTKQQISGNNALDFSNPLTFNVLSEDQSVLKQWDVSVNLTSDKITYYKKDAVCYRGGAIKILYPNNNFDVVLSKGGVPIATQTINNGEAIFNDLETGLYKIKIGRNIKEITLRLK